MKNKSKSHRDIWYYFNRLISIFSYCLFFFFVIAWLGEDWTTQFYKGEINHHHIIWPLASGYFFHNLTKEDKKLFYKKNKKKNNEKDSIDPGS